MKIYFIENYKERFGRREIKGKALTDKCILMCADMYFKDTAQEHKKFEYIYDKMEKEGGSIASKLYSQIDAAQLFKDTDSAVYMNLADDDYWIAVRRDDRGKPFLFIKKGGFDHEHDPASLSEIRMQGKIKRRTAVDDDIGIPANLPHISVSHSEDVFACVFADYNTGLDIQFQKNIDYRKLSRRYYTPMEQEYVREAGEDGFYELWTRKEALAKFTGEGLADAIGTNTFACNSGQIFQRFDPDILRHGQRFAKKRNESDSEISTGCHKKLYCALCIPEENVEQHEITLITR